MTSKRRPFKIDQHPQREQILHDMVEGIPDSHIAEKYGLARTTVIRYRTHPEIVREQARVIEESYQKLVDNLANRLIDKVQDIDKIHDGLRSLVLDENDALLVDPKNPLKTRGVFETIKLLMKAQEVFAGHLMRLEQLGFRVAQSKAKDIEKQTNELIDVILEALDPFPEARQAVVDAVQRITEVPEQGLT